MSTPSESIQAATPIGRLTMKVPNDDSARIVPYFCSEGSWVKWVDVRDRLASLSAALAENARLAAIVARLPVTRDGAPVFIGMRFWLPSDADDLEFEGWIVTGIGPEEAVEHQHYDWVRTNGVGYLTTTAIYSTREAAAAASSPPQGQGGTPNG